MKKRYVLTTILVTIIIIESTILAVDYGRSRTAELSSEDLKYLLSSEESSFNCEKKESSYIPVKTALEALDKFKSRQGIFYRVKRRAYGHYFPMDTLKVYWEKIEEFNRLQTDESKKINGIRIYRSRNDYRCIKQCDDQGRVIDCKPIKYDDVFLIPTIGDRDNLYKIDPDYDKANLSLKAYFKLLSKEFLKDFGDEALLNDESLILNASIPCPNNCDQTY